MYNFSICPQKCIALVNKCISDIKLVLADTHSSDEYLYPTENLKDRDGEFHDFRFFCLRHNLTYEDANEILYMISNSSVIKSNNNMRKTIERELPEFCRS